MFQTVGGLRRIEKKTNAMIIHEVDRRVISKIKSEFGGIPPTFCLPYANREGMNTRRFSCINIPEIQHSYVNLKTICLTSNS